MKNDNSVIVLASLRIKEDFCDEFIENAKIVVEATRKEVGCVRYELIRDVFAPDVFRFIEEYVDDKAFALHRSMPYMTPFREYRQKVVAEYMGVETFKRIDCR
ncbi:MAG: antibiotic biosynthesis monooxygenase [Opitutales bacterium]|nr:antibiotic biosynthesis monooxygenase [Opitutales bacterium]